MVVPEVLLAIVTPLQVLSSLQTLSKCDGHLVESENVALVAIVFCYFFSKSWDSNLQHVAPVKAMALLCTHDGRGLSLTTICNYMDSSLALSDLNN